MAIAYFIWVYAMDLNQNPIKNMSEYWIYTQFFQFGLFGYSSIQEHIFISTPISHGYESFSPCRTESILMHQVGSPGCHGYSMCNVNTNNKVTLVDNCNFKKYPTLLNA